MDDQALMAHASPSAFSALSGLSALCTIARFHQIAADPATLAHQLGSAATDTVSTDDLLRAAKHLGLKAKRSTSRLDRLALTPLPALALMRGGEGSGQANAGALQVVVLAQCDGQRVLLQKAGTPGPTIEPVETFAQHWTGDLILIASRASQNR